MPVILHVPLSKLEYLHSAITPPIAPLPSFAAPPAKRSPEPSATLDAPIPSAITTTDSTAKPATEPATELATAAAAVTAATVATSATPTILVC